MSRDIPVRTSREPVKFEPEGRGWSIRDSWNSQSVPDGENRGLPPAPAPIRSLSPIPPSPMTPARTPLAVRRPVADVTNLVLGKEIGCLEVENAVLKKDNQKLRDQNTAYEKVVSGLCKLYSDPPHRVRRN